MTLETKELVRTFRYNSVDLPDPGAQYTVEQVRDFYSATYPEITSAAVEGPEEKDGKLVYTFRRAVGTKGNEPLAQVGRLALREEGSSWVAYYAMPGTMEGAIFLGAIRMGAVTTRPERRQQFMDLMREVVSDTIEDTVGTRPTWGGPQKAPEHERSGHG
jgi:PRTRC genetic system protein C